MVSSSADGVEYHEDYPPNIGGGFFIGSFHIATQDSSCHSFTVVSTIIYRQGTRTGANRFFLKFDLGDVDPDSIDQDPSGRVVFRITDNRHTISVLREMAEDVNHLTSGQLISREELAARADDNFLVSDNGYRSRLTKAFKRAVILCGGKPSTF